MSASAHTRTRSSSATGLEVVARDRLGELLPAAGALELCAHRANRKLRGFDLVNRRFNVGSIFECKLKIRECVVKFTAVEVSLAAMLQRERGEAQPLVGAGFIHASIELTKCLIGLPLVLLHDGPADAGSERILARAGKPRLAICSLRFFKRRVEVTEHPQERNALVEGRERTQVTDLFKARLRGRDIDVLAERFGVVTEDDGSVWHGHERNRTASVSAPGTPDLRRSR